MAGLSAEDWKTAVRAMSRGPAPEEPAARAAAAWLLGGQLAKVRRRRTPFLIGYSIVIPLAIYGAVVHSPWFWAAVPIVGAMFVLALQAPRILERRLALLGEALPQT
jgi:Flp pilus assembly protein TadB